jgi:hypothetical protein
MSKRRNPERARAALASYLRLLAACLEDEADLIENDPERCDDVLRRFREGVLSLSLEDAPLDSLMHPLAPSASNGNGNGDEHDVPPSENGSTVMLSGTPEVPERPNRN